MLYSVSNRNSIVFEDSGKDNKKETGKTATDSDKKTAENKQDKEKPEAKDDLDSGAETLVTMWREFKKANPNATLDEFYSTFANMNKEG